MKFKNKIFWLCITIYLSTLTITAIVITRKSYFSLLKTEIDRCIKEEKTVQYSITLYQVSNERLNQNEISTRGYLSSVKDMFGSKETYLEFYGFDFNRIASNVPYKWNIKRDELNAILNGKSNYVLRKIDGKHYIFITDTIKSDYDEVIMQFIKDISYVDKHEKEQYFMFLESGMIGLVIVAFCAKLMGNFVVKPIEKLSIAAKNIASGDYTKRVNIMTKDEVGFLAKQFNIMADEIEKKINELKDEDNRKQIFINNITHELRTPLTSVIGYSELLQKIAYEPQLYNKSLGYINSEGNRMLKMISSLKESILLKNSSIHKEKYDIIPLIEEVCDIMKVKSQKKNILFQVYGSTSVIKMNRDLIKEVLINIIDNAINISGEGSKIIIYIKKLNEHICVCIRDYGRGMSEENVKRVTEPFYRVDSSRSRKEGGMGLGLYICSEIVKAHGGELKIESKIGCGTTVMIIF